MLTQRQRVFNHEDRLITRQSRCDRAFGQYAGTSALHIRGLNVDINTYSIAPQVTLNGSSMPSGFSVLHLFALRKYVGIYEGYRGG